MYFDQASVLGCNLFQASDLNRGTCGSYNCNQIADFGDHAFDDVSALTTTHAVLPELE